jgi:hypothetical protein
MARARARIRFRRSSAFASRNLCRNSSASGFIGVSARDCREDYCSIRFHGMMSHNTRSPFRVRAHACHVDCCSTHSRRNLIRNRCTFLRPSCVHVSCEGCCSIRFQKRMNRSIYIDSYVFVFVVYRPGLLVVSKSGRFSCCRTSRCGTGYRERHSATGLKVVVRLVISTRGGQPVVHHRLVVRSVSVEHKSMHHAGPVKSEA